MKGIADELAAAGKPLGEDDLVDQILQGLVHEPDYNGFVSAISTRAAMDQQVRLTELFSLLLAAEARITAQQAAFSPNHSTNLASRGGERGGGRGGGGRGGYNNNSGPPRHNDNSGGGSSGGAPHKQGGDRGDRERCQIYKEEGHGAWRCRKRYDRNYNNNVCNPAGGGGGGNSGGGSGGNGGQHRAANAAHSYGVDTNWYLDTGATDHITGELEKLAIRDRYTGNEQIHSASGQGMDIAHIGHSVLSTPSGSLKLNNILHVPNSEQSLLSAYQLMKDNHVFIELHPETFLVKDQATRRTILQNKSRWRLFPVTGRHSAPQRQVLGAIKPSRSRWHKRLGHPSLPVVQKIVRDFNLPVSNKQDHLLVWMHIRWPRAINSLILAQLVNPKLL